MNENGYVLFWRYTDGSGMDIVRIYTNKDRAEEDFELVQDDTCKKYQLKEVPILRASTYYNERH